MSQAVMFTTEELVEYIRAAQRSDPPEGLDAACQSVTEAFESTDYLGHTEPTMEINLLHIWSRMFNR